LKRGFGSAVTFAKSELFVQEMEEVGYKVTSNKN